MRYITNENPWGDRGVDRDMPTVGGENLTYVKRGVLWVQREPTYIVELVKEPDLRYVMVYNVHPGSNPPKKRATEVVENKNTFSQNTKLGQLANKMFPSKKVRKWKENPPVFVAPIVPNQIATLTGKREDGFFEREPDRLVTIGGERKLQRGKPTGVFIGLSSIDWEEGYTIPTESILKALNQYKETMFYDLEGNNEDSLNPLSRYYKDK